MSVSINTLFETSVIPNINNNSSITLSLEEPSSQVRKTATNWFPSSFGIWQDEDNMFTGYLPDVDDKVWHYGPARIWSQPIQRSRYSMFISTYS